MHTLRRTTRNAASVALVVLLSSLAGCDDELADNPTWRGEIEELMISNCGRCHGPTLPESPGNVPAGLRLDLYQSDDPSLRTISTPGVVDRIRARSIDYENTLETSMPPDSYMTKEQKDLLERWLDNGAPLGDPT